MRSTRPGTHRPPGRSLYGKLEQKLTSLLPDTSCPAKIKAETKKALAALGNIHSLDYLRTFEAITVNPLRERYREFASHHAGVQEQYRERVARYVSLCSLVGCEAKKVPVTEEGAAFLETELSGLEKQLVRQREQEYISSCVDQVMAEMGYDLIGRRNVRKRSGKRFRNHLYSFGEGTAVNVTYSTDGQIAMELGGIDRGDRVPSPEETDMLCKDMESFCDSFAEMERRLRDKGVVIGKWIALSPPSPEFTSIINLNDYDVKTPESIASIAAGKKPKKASVKRSMRREND